MVTKSTKKVTRPNATTRKAQAFLAKEPERREALRLGGLARGEHVHAEPFSNQPLRQLDGVLRLLTE